MSDDTKYMKLALEAARNCKSEDGKISPLVGAVVVLRNGQIVESYRGEISEGEHAEYTALERKLKNEVVAGATVYTTLEPCTSRHGPKIPCAERLIERKVSRVVIGMVDPNPTISGKGIRRLREANITIDMFEESITKEIEELNREFTRDQKKRQSLPELKESNLASLKARSLDDIYRSSNSTYWNQNYHRDASSIFTHLVEVVGGLSALASSKKKPGVHPESHIAKAFAWWLSLCGKLGIRSVEQMIWDKFPSACPYCQKQPHDPDTCSFEKAKHHGPSWSALGTLGQQRERPKRIREWQRMFSGIYPAQQTEDFGPSFARLAEELGELAEAVRVFRTEPGYVLSEATDVFAWLMHIQNIIDSKSGVAPDNRGNALEEAIARSYPGGCTECGQAICSCPPILSSTIGRIAHEVPQGRSSFGESGRFMSPEVASKFFQDHKH
jgi:pyrimidine deaminase RibD-like protein/NTP pyrophosphatase (non-canonical NTP hydrolase)